MRRPQPNKAASSEPAQLAMWGRSLKREAAKCWYAANGCPDMLDTRPTRLARQILTAEVDHEEVDDELDDLHHSEVLLPLQR